MGNKSPKKFQIYNKFGISNVFEAGDFLRYLQITVPFGGNSTVKRGNIAAGDYPDKYIAWLAMWKLTQ